MEDEKEVTPAERRKVALSRDRGTVFARQTAYRLVFKDSEATKAVLEDLAKFCRANRSTFHADPRMHAVLEGRREVYLRLMHHLKLSSEELWVVYSGGSD